MKERLKRADSSVGDAQVVFYYLIAAEKRRSRSSGDRAVTREREREGEKKGVKFRNRSRPCQKARERFDSLSVRGEERALSAINHASVVLFTVTSLS